MFSYCSGMGAGGWLLMIGLWAALLGVVVWAVTRLFPFDSRHDPIDDPSQRLTIGGIEQDSQHRALDDFVDSGSR